MKTYLLTGIVALTAPALDVAAGPRSSTDYAITAETVDFGGQDVVTTSADYAQIGSLAVIVGSSETAAPTTTLAKHGYIGQLYELLGYGLLASNYYPPEVGTTQLFPVRTADDGTNVVIPTAGFTFAALEGPIPEISATGLVSTTSVYENTAAIIGATSPAFAGQLQLTIYVQDTLPDNYSTYAGDGLADGWQVQYFGLDNPLAAPGVDASGTGQTNLFKYVAGLDPLDPSSVFRLRLEPVTGQPAQKRIVFGPVLADRSYTVKAKAVLTDATWQALADEVSDGLLPERSVTDRAATGGRKFYQVEITKP